MTAIDLLNQVIDLFENNRDGSKILNYLLEHNMLHSSFEQRYIVNNVDFQFILTKTVYRDDKSVDFYLEAMDGCPYKVEILHEDKWYLKSFRFLCQGCLGDDNECNVCGGSGWGVL